MHFLFAYIDPGVGLLAWQAAVATVLGAVFYLKKTRDGLVRLVVKPFQKGKTQAAVQVKAPASDAPGQ